MPNPQVAHGNPHMGHGNQQMSYPNPQMTHGVMLRNKHHQAPMTRYYEQPQMSAPQQQPRVNDFPPPPAFITEIKDISRRVQNPQPNMDDFNHLPPPPPELILQEARNNIVSQHFFSYLSNTLSQHENGYRTISNRPRPPPP